MDPSRSSPRILSLKIQFACTASLFDVLRFGLPGEGGNYTCRRLLPSGSIISIWAVGRMTICIDLHLHLHLHLHLPILSQNTKHRHNTVYSRHCTLRMVRSTAKT